MTGELLWRAFGPVWATGVILVMVFPLTLALVAATVHGAVVRRRRAPGPPAFPPQLLLPAAPVLLTWVVAAAFVHRTATATEPPSAWPTSTVLGLFALNVGLAVVLWSRYREVPGRTPLLLLQAWVGLVAAFIGLWWVQGWPSL